MTTDAACPHCERLRVALAASEAQRRTMRHVLEWLRRSAGVGHSARAYIEAALAGEPKEGA